MKKILIIGASGGIGSAIINEVAGHSEYKITGYTSRNLNLNYPDRIFNEDFSEYDVLINASGHSQGTYLGFQKNSWQNQLSQITVNYISNLFLLKQYASQRKNGQYIWISTSLLDGARPFHSVYAATKMASKYSFELISQEINHIVITEIKVGPTKTNFRYRNFEGTKEHQEVNALYDLENGLEPSYVARQILSIVGTSKNTLNIK